MMFDAFLDICMYPLYQMNIQDDFMGILCGMLFVFWLFHFLCKVVGSLL